MISPRPTAVLACLLACAGVVVVHVGAALHAGMRVATADEAQLAAAALAARGVDFGAVTLPWVDQFAAHQLGVLETLLPMGGVPVVDAARWASLAVGALAAMLLWPIVRRFDVGVGPAAATVVIAGVLPPATLLHSGIGAGGLAAAWLAAAGVSAARARRGALPAAVFAVAAAATAPLAGALLLVLAAHLVAARVVLPGLGTPVRRLVTLVLAGSGLAVGIMAVGAGPLAGAAGPVVAWPVAVAGAAVGAVLLAVAWLRLAWLRPLFTATAAIVAALLVPGPAAATAAVLAIGPLAVVAGLVADDVVGLLTTRLGTAAPLRSVVTATAVLVAIAVGLLPVDGPVQSPPPTLVAWIGTELTPGTIVRGDALDRAELAAAGLSPQRLGDVTAPAAAGDVLLLTDRPSADRSTAPWCPPAAVLATMARGSGGAPAVVCSGDVAAAQETAAERPERIRLGAALAGNPALVTGAAAAAALRGGTVDARLILVLTAMTRSSTIEVSDFPSADFEPPDAPRRRMLIARANGVPATGAAMQMLRNWLGGQKPPFRPTDVLPTPAGLLVGYTTPAPRGLLPD